MRSGEENRIKTCGKKKMRYLLLTPVLLLLTGCGAGIFSGILGTVDDIATDECIEIKIYRDAFKKDADVKASVEVNNKS